MPQRSPKSGLDSKKYLKSFLKNDANEKKGTDDSKTGMNGGLKTHTFDHIGSLVVADVSQVAWHVRVRPQ